MTTIRRSIDTSSNVVTNKINLEFGKVCLIFADRFKPIENQLIHHNMKTFQIEVVRTYTTTIEVEVPDNLSAFDAEVITTDRRTTSPHSDLHDEIWEQIGEQELQQMDTDLLSVKAKEVYHEEFKSFNDAPYGQDDE